MSLTNVRLVTLNYGTRGRFSCEVAGERIMAFPTVPQPNPRFAEELRETLAEPLDFPPLEQAIIPDDHVTLAVDPETPQAAALVAAAWQALTRRHVVPENLTILQPVSSERPVPPDPRQELPAEVRDRVRWKLHQPADVTECAYLAATAAGDRVYLAPEAVHADVLISIGRIGYDPLLGYRGTHSVFYPGLSTADAVERAHGQGHSELEPDDARPLRQTIDEIGWLLGTQFSIQVVPSAGGGVAHVLAGAADSVFRRGKQLLAEHWLVELDFRPDIVVAAVDDDGGGSTWEQVGAALAAARNLVARGGKIVLLTELDAELRPGLELVRGSESPREALRPLRKAAPPDLVSATQLAAAGDWADVYLLSRLESDLVEELFLVPLESPDEAARVLEGDGTCAFLPSAQHVFSRIRRE